jgi:hypothetical protein
MSTAKTTSEFRSSSPQPQSPAADSSSATSSGENRSWDVLPWNEEEEEEEENLAAAAAVVTDVAAASLPPFSFDSFAIDAPAFDYFGLDISWMMGEEEESRRHSRWRLDNHVEAEDEDHCRRRREESEGKDADADTGNLRVEYDDNGDDDAVEEVRWLTTPPPPKMGDIRYKKKKVGLNTMEECRHNIKKTKVGPKKESWTWLADILLDISIIVCVVGLVVFVGTTIVETYLASGENSAAQQQQQHKEAAGGVDGDEVNKQQQ